VNRAISIIFSSYNESQNELFKKSIIFYSELKKSIPIEIICVDGSSNDGTLDFLKQYPVTIISSESKNRAERYNEGSITAQGDLLIIQHPRSFLDAYAINEVINHDFQFSWGAFTHQFNHSHPLLKFTSWYSNYIRGDLFNIYYLDHCYVIKKELFEKVNGFPDIAIFEDTELCKRLKQFSKPIRFHSISTTSAIRFLKNGVLKQAILNQWMKLNYFIFFRPEKMNEIYEKDINLNK
jgi:GT2 family glycosyltransferase